MKKTIWIINQYGSTPATGMGGRHYYLAEELAILGYDVYLIASASNHLLHTKPIFTENFKIEKISGFNFVWVKMPDYSQAHSKRRALGWLLFPWRIQKLVKIISTKPDVILCSSPSLMSFLGAQRLAKKLKSKLVFEVRDIWPLSLIEIGGFSPKHPLIRFMKWLEKKAYRDSDVVLSNLKNAVEHMAKHGLDRRKFSWIPNGFSIREVSKKEPLSPLAAAALPKGKFIVGYTGTLGVANTLNTLLTAAELLKSYENIAFVLVGTGKEKAALQTLAIEKQLTNVTFIDPIPKIQIQAMLNRFDACYIGWLNDSLYRFGIGANKIPEYMYSGKPIVHSYSGACDPIEEFKAGLCIEAQAPRALADAILQLYNMPQEQRQLLGENGKQAALEHYEYGILAKRLADVLFS